MTPLFGHEQAVKKLVASLIDGLERGFEENARAIGVIDSKGRLIGGIVYHNFNPEHGVIEMSGASLSKRWLNKRVIKTIFSYPFDVAKCQAAIMQNSEHDKALHRQLLAIGFAQYVIPRLRGKNEAAHLFVLTDDEWERSKFNGDLKDGKTQGT